MIGKEMRFLSAPELVTGETNAHGGREGTRGWGGGGSLGVGRTDRPTDYAEVLGKTVRAGRAKSQA